MRLYPALGEGSQYLSLTCLSFIIKREFPSEDQRPGLSG